MQYTDKAGNVIQINQMKLGVVVSRRPLDFFQEDPKFPIFGHITGFTTNCYNEPTILVKWMDGKDNGIHPSNVTFHL